MIENVLDRDILSFEIEKSCVDEKKVIGSFQKNTATIELLNPENKYSNLKGTYINTYMGTFFVDEISPVQEDIKIKLSCYDLTQKFEEKYDNSKFTFPMTLKAWRNKICDIVGVGYDNSDFSNGDYELNSEPYIKKDATYKDVIKLIAQASSSWAIIGYDDKLYFNWFKDDGLVDVEDWFDLTTEDNSSNPVNMVVLGRGDVEDNVIYPETEPENVKEIRIDSNDILDLDRSGMIVPIYEQVNGFKYIIYNMKTSGFLNARVGDKIKYLDLYGNEKESYVMKHKLTFLGGDFSDERNYTSNFEAVEMDETNTNYKYAESIEERIDKTEIKTNKLDGEITAVVQKTQNIANDLNENYYSKTSVNEMIMNSSNGVTNTFSEAGGNNVFKNTSLSSSAEGLVTVTEKEKEITLNNPKNFTLENLKINGINYQKEIPTVNNPQEIKTVTENMIVKSVGKNLFSSELELGSILSTGELQNNENVIRTKEYIKIEPSTIYSIWNSNSYTINLYYYNYSQEFISASSTSVGKFTTPANAYYFKTRTNASSIENNLNTNYFLMKGDFHLDENNYEPYKETTLCYDLEDNFMTEIDYIENGVLHKKTRHLSLAIKDMDNDEDYPGWTNMTQLKEDYPNFNGRLSVKGKFISNISNAPDAFSVNTTGANNKKLYLGKSVWGLTQSQWKEQYPDLVLDLYYEILEVEKINIASVGELKFYENNTNITNNFNSLMEIKYTKENDGYEFWNGNVIKNPNDNSASFSSMLLQKGTLSQEQDVTNGNYSVSFYYQKLNEFANASVVINDKEYPLDSTEIKQFYTGEQDPETGEYVVQPVEVTSKHIKIEFKCDIPNGVEVWDLMCNKGTVKLAWSQNQNEVTTDTVNISKGITITSTNIEAIFKANANGIRILTLQGVTVAYFTDKGLSTKELIVENKAQICGTLVQEVDSQTWFTRM